MESSPVRVLGLDPGFDRLGIAIIEEVSRGKNTLLYSACFTTDRALPFAERLTRISEKLQEAVAEYSPNLCALEKLFFNQNKQTAMRVAETRGVILELAARAHLEIVEFTPAQIKVAVTGYGKATKDDITRMIPRLITLSHAGATDDEYDAIACGLTALATRVVKK